MAGLSASRNTPEWHGGPSKRFHFGLIPVEASTSLYVGGIVALNGNGRAVPAQSLGAAPLDKLNVIGIVEYVYAGGIVPPGIDALNQTGNGALYPGATATLGNAGAISVGVVQAIFGFDYDSTVVAAAVGQLVFASDDHTVVLGTAIANTTSLVLPNASALAPLSTPQVTPGTFNMYQNSGGTGTHYKEYVDFLVDYQMATVRTLSGGALPNGATVYVSYSYGGIKPVAGRLVSLESGQAWVDLSDTFVDV